MAVLTSCFLYDLAAILVAGFAVVYAYYRHSFSYWRKRGIPSPAPPSFPSGNFPGVSIKRSLDVLLGDLYLKHRNEPLFGAYFLARPIVVPCDLDIIRSILIKDFSNFQDRGVEFNYEKDPLAANLFMLSGHDWRNLRVTLTPTFTSGKMKMMYPTLVDVGKQLKTVLEDETSKPESEIKDIMARYTTDVIASVAFGIEANSLKNPKVEFRTITQEFSNPSLKQMLIQFIMLFSTRLTKLLGIRFAPKHVTKFFVDLVQETMDFREKNNVKRNDFLQLLLQLKNLGYVKDVDHQEVAENDKQKFSVEQAAAQAFLFFFAGFETSSSTMQYALYELALNQDLQNQLHDEITRTKAKHDGSLTYEALGEMELLDRVVSETLRKYPVAAVLLRVCEKEYQVPGTDYKLLPKDSINIPVYGIHHNPDIYPNPSKFDPDRFLPDVKESRHPCAYLPFGDGPRSCIGNRFALLQTKAGLALILSDFIVSPSKRTPIPMKFDPRSGVMKPKDPIYLKMARRA